MLITAEAFNEFVTQQEDDMPTFLDGNKGEIEELFETGSVTIDYATSNGMKQEFIISLDIRTVDVEEPATATSRAKLTGELSRELKNVILRYNGTITMAEAIGTVEIVKQEIIQNNE